MFWKVVAELLRRKISNLIVPVIVFVTASLFHLPDVVARRHLLLTAERYPRWMSGAKVGRTGENYSKYFGSG